MSTPTRTTVIYHSADYDGIFCREIAKRSLGADLVDYIGWNFGDPRIPIPSGDGQIYVLDLSPDCLADGPLGGTHGMRLIWIDHHKTSIDKWPKDIPGYRIDGVAACRLAWQWFNRVPYPAFDKEFCELPCKEYFIRRSVREPLAIRLAGEYDIWDHRGDGDLEFQFGLRSEESPDYVLLLDGGAEYTKYIANQGCVCMRYQRLMDAQWLKETGHIVEWEGLRFLAKNSVERGSGVFESKDCPETGHDALMLYGYRGKYWTVSLYHAKHRTDLDLSAIAVKHGGGGHKGACGFTAAKLPFL
jgi:uncharacterized protein